MCEKSPTNGELLSVIHTTQVPKDGLHQRVNRFLTKTMDPTQRSLYAAAPEHCTRQSGKHLPTPGNVQKGLNHRRDRHCVVSSNKPFPLFSNKTYMICKHISIMNKRSHSVLSVRVMKSHVRPRQTRFSVTSIFKPSDGTAIK